VVNTGAEKWRVPVYVTVAVAAVMTLAGFALGSFSTANSRSISQGTEVDMITPVEGLTWESTTLMQVTSIVNSNCGSSPGCSLDSASVVWCGNPCGSSNDFFEVVVLGVDAGSSAIICGAADTTVNITLSYTVGGTVTTRSPGYFYDTAAATGSTTITLYVDVTSGGVPQAVSEVATTANCM
jgi:hypothetical protein